MRSSFVTLAPGPRGPMLFSTSVLVCVATRTQESEVRNGQSQRPKQGAPPALALVSGTASAGGGGFVSAPAFAFVGGLYSHLVRFVC